MLPSHRLPVHGRAYVSAVIVLGFAVVSHSVYELTVHPGYQWFLLIALTLVSGSATVKLPSVTASISISETFVFTAVLLYGPAAGTLTVALDGWSFLTGWPSHVAGPRLVQHVCPGRFRMDIGPPVFFTRRDRSNRSGSGPLQGTLNQILPSLFLFALKSFGLNSWLIALAISIETRLSPLSVWWNNFVWLSLNYFCGASVAILLVFSTPEVDIASWV